MVIWRISIVLIVMTQDRGSSWRSVDIGMKADERANRQKNICFWCPSPSPANPQLPSDRQKLPVQKLAISSIAYMGFLSRCVATPTSSSMVERRNVTPWCWVNSAIGGRYFPCDMIADSRRTNSRLDGWLCSGVEFECRTVKISSV